MYEERGIGGNMKYNVYEMSGGKDSKGTVAFRLGGTTATRRGAVSMIPQGVRNILRLGRNYHYYRKER